MCRSSSGRQPPRTAPEVIMTMIITIPCVCLFFGLFLIAYLHGVLALKAHEMDLQYLSTLFFKIV